MDSPEQLKGSSEQVETGGKFSDSVRGLEAAMGPEIADLPNEPSEVDFDAAERNLTADNRFGGFNEQFRANEIIYRRKGLEQRGLMERDAGAVSPEELATTNQAITYHEYLPAVIRDIHSTMQRYEAMRSSVSPLPPSLQLQELQARVYMDALSKALRERVVFANVLLADGKIARTGNDAALLIPLRDQALASQDLSPESLAALRGTDMRMKWERGNALNQKIIDLLSGQATISGVDKGFLPQNMYLELVTYRYKEVLEQEKAIVRDLNLTKATERRDALKAKNDRGESLSPEELKEYEQMQARIADRTAELEKRAKERRFLTDELLYITNDLGGDQMHRAELTTIQHQFGERFDFEGVRAPTTEQTPENIKAAIREQMKQRSEFHLNRMDAFMGRFDDEVLGEGVALRIEDFSNKKGSELVQAVSHGLARLFTIFVPETLGAKNMAQSWLTEPLDKALGWPPGKDSWEELTSEEKAVIEGKAKSILDAVRAFDRTSIERFRSTVSIIQGMPAADTLTGTEVLQPLPTERVTSDNRNECINKYGAQTVYLMLFAQLNADWGTEQPPSGFIGQYSILLDAVNANIDTHLEKGEAIFQISENYKKVEDYLLLVAAGAFAAGLLLRNGWSAIKTGGRKFLKGGRWVLEKTPKGPLAAVALAEGQMMLERTVAHALIIDREERRLKAAEEMLSALQKGEDTNGRKLSLTEIDERSRACAVDVLAAILQTNHVNEATVLPYKSGHEMTQPNAVLFFEAYVAANDIMASYGFNKVLELPPGYVIPEDASLFSPRAQEFLKARKESTPRPRSAFAALEGGSSVSQQLIESAAESPEFAIAYAEFEKTANRTEILWTMGRIFRWKYDMVTKIEEPARKPDLLTSATHRRAIEEIISANELRSIDSEARVLADMPPKQFLLMATYLQKNPPTNEEILRWYNGVSITARGVEKVYGPENNRTAFVRKAFQDWSVARSYADTYVLHKENAPGNPDQATIEKMQARFEKGQKYMKEINANDNGSYYTKQYGYWGNYYLYIQFDASRGKWQCDLGDRKDMHDPVEGGGHFKNTGLSWGAGTYNDVADKLARINEDRE